MTGAGGWSDDVNCAQRPLARMSEVFTQASRQTLEIRANASPHIIYCRLAQSYLICVYRIYEPSPRRGYKVPLPLIC
jgi:hypothetical protein